MKQKLLEITTRLPLNNKHTFRKWSLLVDDLEKFQKSKKEAAVIANNWQHE